MESERELLVRAASRACELPDSWTGERALRAYVELARVLEQDFGGTHPDYPPQTGSLAEEIAAARALANAPVPSNPDEGLELD